MWKVIIKWIESKSYRCKHNWVLERKDDVYPSNGDNNPFKRIITYRCTKCCEFKSKTIE